ncbi:protein NOI4-like isoform X2 [Andrographis paniculata]|uniref:protein NOI4-like isoform X2 n=1 Tax=Andrographis paniculata TaxID=175694 RepID=UPI0021E80B6B|nr:protein NOI4-like isoform X2 [Andrographis paniculata]
MSPQSGKGRGAAVPKFGEWDVNGSDGGAAGFTVIFSQARDERQKAKAAPPPPPPPPPPPAMDAWSSPQYARKKRWLCCF